MAKHPRGPSPELRRQVLETIGHAVGLTGLVIMAMGVWNGEFLVAGALSSHCVPSGKGLVAILAFIVGCGLYIVPLTMKGVPRQLEIAMTGRAIGEISVVGLILVLVAHIEGYLPYSGRC